MSKERKVYAEKAEPLTTLNPFVEAPRMRVSAVNRLNELIKRDNAMPIVRREVGLTEHTLYECPVCGKCFSESGLEEYVFCYKCGQRLDTANIAL